MSDTVLSGDSLVVKLAKPIKVAGTDFQEFTLREPLVRDLRILSTQAAQRDPVTATNQLYSQLTDGQVPSEVFELMPVREMRKITAWFRPFTQEENDTN